jgi:hypothetical protein
VTVWRPIENNGTIYHLDHLHPIERTITVGGKDISIHFSFGYHVFTDEKRDGVRVQLTSRPHEERYFCINRYQSSFQLIDFINRRLETCYIVPYYYDDGAEQYFHLDIDGYAIFATIQQAAGAADTLKFHVISAYEVDSWGKDGLPRGKAYKLRYVLQQRNEGTNVLTRTVFNRR